MKKLFLFSAIFLAVPSIIFATNFDHDILYGRMHDPEVVSLQEFLAKKGFYSSPITGNFLAVTKQALINFQKKEGIMPAQGYFGPKTRAKINMLLGATPISREELIASLQAQINALQAELVGLLAKAALEKQASTTPTELPVALTPSFSPSPFSAPTPTPSPVAELRISGNMTQLFPETAISPLKLGEIRIKNTKDHPILFNQFQLDIYDAMNSSPNRNKTVLFKLRDGINTTNDLISQTEFTINREPPPYGMEANRRQLDISFPITVQPGETKITSLWIENLDYVIDGHLRIEMLIAYINDTNIPQGGFTFLLTKQ